MYQIPDPDERLCRAGNGNGSSNGGSLVWLSPDERTREPFDSSLSAAWQLAQDYDLCITGDAWCGMPVGRMQALPFDVQQGFGCLVWHLHT